MIPVGSLQTKPTAWVHQLGVDPHGDIIDDDGSTIMHGIDLHAQPPPVQRIGRNLERTRRLEFARPVETPHHHRAILEPDHVRQGFRRSIVEREEDTGPPAAHRDFHGPRRGSFDPPRRSKDLVIVMRADAEGAAADAPGRSISGPILQRTELIELVPNMFLGLEVRTKRRCNEDGAE